MAGAIVVRYDSKCSAKKRVATVCCLRDSTLTCPCIASSPSTDSNLSAKAMERSACSALNPRERRNPVRYAVDGYGVLSCVIGGMIDRMRSSVMSESISRGPALQDLVQDWPWNARDAGRARSDFPRLAAT